MCRQIARELNLSLLRSSIDEMPPIRAVRAVREGQILAIDKQADILNCGIAAYDFVPNAHALCVPTLALWNHGAPLEEQGTPKTAEPDMMTGSR